MDKLLKNNNMIVNWQCLIMLLDAGGRLREIGFNWIALDQKKLLSVS